MGFHDFISEGEAATLAGVSANTLRRFAEAGYLHAESDHDGIQLFSRGEVQSLFQIHGNTSSNSPAAESNSKEPIRPLRQSIEVLVEKGTQHREFAPAQTLRWDDEHREEATEDLPSPQAARVEPEPTPANEIPRVEMESLAPSNATLEVHRLKHLVELHEKLLDLKDQQIQDLTKEREWLRTRIEKLEDKHDRDQLILLSETQMLRKVLVLNERKKSPWRAALEWFGVTSEATPSEGGSYEMGRSEGGTYEVPRPKSQ